MAFDRRIATAVLPALIEVLKDTQTPRGGQRLVTRTVDGEAGSRVCVPLTGSDQLFPLGSAPTDRACRRPGGKGEVHRGGQQR